MNSEKDKENIEQDGYIDDEVAIAHKKVGDAPGIGIVKDTDTGTYVVITGKPTFVIHPITKRRVNIKDIFKTDRDTKCPKCQEMNGPGVVFRVLENGEFIYECPKCENYTFCKTQ